LLLVRFKRVASLGLDACFPRVRKGLDPRCQVLALEGCSSWRRSHKTCSRAASPSLRPIGVRSRRPQCKKMFASTGEIAEPCGLQRSLGLRVPLLWETAEKVGWVRRRTISRRPKPM
jgi:hypothetical protein